MRDIERTSAKNARSPHERKAAKVTQQKEDKERAEKEKRRKEGLKRHESIQTKEVKERLKAHRAASDKRYARKKEFFLKRWFSKH